MNFTLTKKSLTIRIFFLCLLACLNAAGARAQTQTPSPALVVLDKEDNMLSIIDPATSKTIARIPTGDGPHEITASDDGKLAFVANYGARTPGSETAGYAPSDAIRSPVSPLNVQFLTNGGVTHQD